MSTPSKMRNASSFNFEPSTSRAWLIPSAPWMAEWSSKYALVLTWNNNTFHTSDEVTRADRKLTSIVESIERVATWMSGNASNFKIVSTTSFLSTLSSAAATALQTANEIETIFRFSYRGYVRMASLHVLKSTFFDSGLCSSYNFRVVL